MTQDKSQNQDVCWFCGKESSTGHSALEVKLYGNVTRTSLGKQTRVQWQNLTVTIPRCRICKDGHTKARRITNGATVIGKIVSIPIVLYLGNMFFGNYSGPIPIVIPLNLPGILLVLGILASPFIGIAYVFNKIGDAIGNSLLPSSTRPEKSKAKFPIILALKRKGWEIGEKPSS